jgi:hypothetical protein
LVGRATNADSNTPSFAAAWISIASTYFPNPFSSNARAPPVELRAPPVELRAANAHTFERRFQRLFMLSERIKFLDVPKQCTWVSCRNPRQPLLLKQKAWGALCQRVRAGLTMG